MGKTYVVFKGRNPGIYSTWEETDAQVTGFKLAVHKSYQTRYEAVKAFNKYMEKSHSTQASPCAPKNKGKTYVVFKGLNPGIYGTWEETDAQVTGFRCAVHKSYQTRDEAVRAYTTYMEKRHSTQATPCSPKNKGKTYVVFKGLNPGIYNTWEEAALQVSGFKGAVYKSYHTRDEAYKACTKYMDKKHPTEAPCAPKNEGSSSTASSSSVAAESMNLSELIAAQLQLAHEQRQHSLRVAKIYEGIEKKLRSFSLKDDAK